MLFLGFFVLLGFFRCTQTIIYGNVKKKMAARPLKRNPQPMVQGYFLLSLHVKYKFLEDSSTPVTTESSKQDGA